MMVVRLSLAEAVDAALCGSGAAAEPCAVAEPATKPVKRRPARTPAHIYVNVCSACHREGGLDAPRVGSRKDWAPRIAKGMDTLHQHALYGFNSMPPRGTCNRCSDDDIKAAVDYMVEKSR